MSARILAFLFALVVLAVAPRAFAHKPSDGYLMLDVGETTIRLRLDLAIRDLEPLLGLDADHDGVVRYRELVARADALHAYAADRVTVGVEGVRCIPEAVGGGALEVVEHTDGHYVVLERAYRCGRAVRAVEVDYRVLFDRDALHRGLVRLGTGADASTEILTATRSHVTLPVARAATTDSFASAVREGISHIAEGIDHLFFLLALLLPAVIQRRDREVSPVGSFRVALWDVARVVTAFTIAHSITLSLSALSVVRLPSRLVETSIAVSVVAAALNNVVPVLGRDRWFAAFALGLLHGFGFSAVLSDLGLPMPALVRTLVGFNVGVELGQLAFVAVVFPLAYWVRRSRVYVPVLLRGGSALVGAVALAWAVERAFDVRIF